MQLLNQRVYWYSESNHKYEEIATMPCPYALRCLAKLERTRGWTALESELGKALKLRAEQGIEAEVTDVMVGKAGKKMLRNKKSGKFTGAYIPKRSVK